MGGDPIDDPLHFRDQPHAQSCLPGLEVIARNQQFLGRLIAKNDREGHHFARASASASTSAQGRTASGFATLSARRRSSSAFCQSGSGAVSTSWTTLSQIASATWSRSSILRRSIPRSCSETLAMSASKQNGVPSVSNIRLCTTRVKHAEHERASDAIVPDPSPDPKRGLVRESSCPGGDLKGFSRESPANGTSATISELMSGS